MKPELNIRAEARGAALVRDKDGRPKVDDPANLPEELRALLTVEERHQLGVK